MGPSEELTTRIALEWLRGKEGSERMADKGVVTGLQTIIGISAANRDVNAEEPGLCGSSLNSVGKENCCSHEERKLRTPESSVLGCVDPYLICVSN